MNPSVRNPVPRAVHALASAFVVASLCPNAGARPPSPPVVHVGEPFAGRPVTSWDYDLDGDNRTDLRKQDMDGDGVVDRYLTDRDADGLFDLAAAKESSDGAPRRHLVICLDSVPFHEMERLWGEGHFRDFFPPSRVIGAFPSDPAGAFPRIFGGRAHAAAEERRFDRASNRPLAGGVGAAGTVFDCEVPPPRGLAARLFARRRTDPDLARCRAALLPTRDEKKAGEPIVIFIRSTGEASRRGGREGLVSRLLEVERMIDEIFFRAAGAVRVSVFSPNGAALSGSAPLRGIKGRLRRKGFVLSDSLDGPRDVVAEEEGGAGGFRVYTAAANRPALAAALAALDGIDFCVYPEGGGFIVEGPRGRAAVSLDGGRFRCALLSGDPLRLGGTMARMRRDGEMDENGFADDAAWLAATRSHIYPDILRRIADAAPGSGEGPDLLVSVADGFCLGGGRAPMRGIRGSATGAQTIGMAMSSARPLPAVMRIAEVAAAVLEAVPEGTPEPTGTPLPTAEPTGTPLPAAGPSATPEPAAIETRPSPPPRLARTRRPFVRALKRTPFPGRPSSPAGRAAQPSNAPE